MTTEEKYTELLKELGELLKNKNHQIAIQECIIENLENKLVVAEQQIKTLKGSTENE